MDTQTLTYLVVGATFALYIGIAIWSRAGSTSEYYVASGGVHPLAHRVATRARWVSAASFISLRAISAAWRSPPAAASRPCSAPRRSATSVP